ncbi:MAG: hypothetical protein AAF221_05205 [Pseudomonadota bacterium]
MMRTIVLTAALLSALPFAAQAQSSRCDRMPTEEEYQRCIEREGSNEGFDPRDIGAGSSQGTPPPQDFEPAPPPEPAEPIDTLPPESRRHVQQEMAKKVYAKVGEWTPQAQDQDYDFEPSEAAQNDPQLRQQEEAAFADELEAYHDREQQAAGGGQPGGQEGKSEQPGGGNVAVRGDVNEQGTPGQGGGASGGQSRSVLDILGDLTATGTGSNTGDQPSEAQTPGQGAAAGEPVQIAGDVTIDREAGQGAGAEGQGGGAGGSSAAEEQVGDGSGAGQGEAGNAAGQGKAQAEPDSTAGGGDLPLASNGENSGTNGALPQAGVEAGQSGEPQQTAQASSPSQTSSEGGSTQQSAPGAPSLPGSESSSPPPSPPRPIPSAEAIAAEMLAKLFGGSGEDGETQEFSDAPFVDWSNPDPEQQPSAQAASNAIDVAAQTALTEPLETQSSPAPDADALARQIAKEEARLAALEAQAADAARIEETQSRIEDLRETEPVTAARAPDAPVSAQASRRIAVMGLP